MQQRQVLFDFESVATVPLENLKLAKSDHIAEATSLPPPPPLQRPDRQLTFGGLPHYEWPAPEHDRDTITVDRIREDIDGPSHRFVICRGDTVEVFFSHQKTDIGEVTGVSHRNNEVRVSFQEGSEGIWVGTGCVYPTPPKVEVRTGKGVPLSKVIAECSVDAPGGLEDLSRTLLILADLAVFPISPSILDVRSVAGATQVLRYAQGINGGKPDGRLVLNKMKTRDTISHELREGSPKLGLQVAQHVIRDLQAYRDAAQQGTVVGRFGRKGAQAAADMDALFTELVGDVVANKQQAGRQKVENG